jgi:hypothetical protein
MMGEGSVVRELTIGQIKQIIEASEKLNAQAATGVVNVTDGDAGMLLRRLLYSLSADAMIELNAMISMGKGDCSDFDTALARAKTRANPIQGISDEASIPKYLRTGAAMMGLQLG